MTFLAVLCATGGFLLLATAMDRHARLLQALRSVASKGLLRLIGGALLLISLLITIAVFGAAFGFIAWWGVLTAGAGAVLLFITWRTSRRDRDRRRP